MATLSEKLQYIISVNADGAIRSFQKIGQNAERELGKAETSMDRLGAKFTKFGVGALATAGVGGVALVRLGQGAANFGETMQKVGVIFGDSTDEITAFGEQAARSLGLSKRAALDASARFAVFGKIVGKSGTELVDYSEALVKRAVDLASFWNTDLESAFTAISSGLQGEALPLRKYGILLDDITLRQRALALQIYDGIGPLSAQQRIAAASAEIFAQNADSIDDYARTAANLPNQQKRLTAELQNTKDALGAAVLPAMVSVTTQTGDLLEKFNALNPGVKNAIGTFAGFGVAALGVAGVASTVIGQVIKMRANFATMGVAAKTASVGIGALGLAIAGLQVVDAVTQSGAFADLSDELNALVVALNQAAGAPVEVTADKIEDLAEAAFKSASSLDKVGDTLDVWFTGADWAEKWGDAVDTAFSQALAQGPAVAQAFIDTVTRIQAMAAAGDEWAQSWMSDFGVTGDMVAAWQVKLDNAEAAAAALAAQAAATANATLNTGDALAYSADQAEKVAEALDKARNEFATQVDDATKLRGAYLNVVDSLEQLASSSDDSTWTEQQQQLNATTQEIIEYISSLGDIPDAQITEILTLLNKGDYDQVLRAINALAATRTISFRPQLIVGGEKDDYAGAAKLAAADFVNAFNTEASRLSRGGGGGGGGGGSSNAVTPEDIAQQWDEVLGRMFDMGEISLADYRNYLTQRLNAYAKYSDEWSSIYGQIAALNEREQDDQDRLVAAMFETGELSTEQYRTHLAERLGAFQKYSDDWMTVWRELQRLEADDERRKEEAAEADRRRREEAQRAADEELTRAANRAIVAANVGGATYATINTMADPNAVVNAIQQYVRRNGPISGIT